MLQHAITPALQYSNIPHAIVFGPGQRAGLSILEKNTLICRDVSIIYRLSEKRSDCADFLGTRQISYPK